MNLPVANFTHQFLLAMPGMADPRFTESVIYMVHHDQDGAVGLVINHATGLSLEELFNEVAIDVEDRPAWLSARVMSGGPVAAHVGFVLHRDQGQWQSSRVLQDNLCLTSSRDILQAIAEGRGPEDFLLILGYAGWGPMQLEQEMVANAWLNCPFNEQIVFHLPLEQRWLQAARTMGVDMRLLDIGVGHA